MRPGVAVRPCRSITCVAGPMRAFTASFDPTAAIVPPLIAIASWTRSLASTVSTMPLVRTRSAGGSGVCAR